MIAIGCFYTHENKEILIGTILSKIKEESEHNQVIFNSVDNQEQLSFWAKLKSVFMCSRPQPRHGCYIMTIGVIDECRKLGIGTYLLKATMNAVLINPSWEQSCKIIYLHVASYNRAAIRFYDRNGFQTASELKDWYDIFGKSYDAFLLYRVIERQPFGTIQSEICN